MTPMQARMLAAKLEQAQNAIVSRIGRIGEGESFAPIIGPIELVKMELERLACGKNQEEERRRIGRAVAVLSDRQDSLTLIAQMKLRELGFELVTDAYDGPHTRAAVGTLIAEAVAADNPGGVA